MNTDKKSDTALLVVYVLLSIYAVISFVIEIKKRNLSSAFLGLIASAGFILAAFLMYKRLGTGNIK